MLEQLAAIFVNNHLLLISSCVVVGSLFGKIKIKHLKLGSSSILFCGLIISYLLTENLGVNIKIDKTLFLLSLIGFIVTVGLIASKNIKKIIKTYGIKFLILGFSITGMGAITTYIFTNLLVDIKASVVGTYVGSLTSSPGLATALEITKTLAVDQSANIGLGYSMAYIPGVIIVIIFSQFMGKNHNANLIKSSKKIEKNIEFNLVSFIIVVLVGIIIGSLHVRLTETISLSLGMTGGVLISALLFGSKQKIGKIEFLFNTKELGIIRDISLTMFLAIVGLNYGYDAINAISEYGFKLLGIGLITGTLSITTGYIVGKYLLKIDSVYLIGGICGGMTSTPGLAAAIDSFESEDVVTGYGATYPFALIFMIIFTNLLLIRS